jgi:tRNA dimethylallyltransferase
MKYIIICGPTCSGKSGLGINLARKYDGEIIGADSRQIYKHINIGTAKPKPEEYAGLKHHLIDCIELNEDFSAFRFAELARDLIKAVWEKGRLPIVVGGTGLYLKALTEGLFEGPQADLEYRSRLEMQADIEGIENLHKQLAKVDSQAAARITPKDRQRIIRALEIHHLTGKPISKLQKDGKTGNWGEPLWIGLNPPRNLLYDNINERVEQMLNTGWEQELLDLEPEVGLLRKKKVVGYNDLIEYLFDKKTTRLEAIERVKQHHRNYAKRQMTWFRKVDGVNWFNPLAGGFLSKVYEICDEYLKRA